MRISTSTSRVIETVCADSCRSRVPYSCPRTRLWEAERGPRASLGLHPSMPPCPTLTPGFLCSQQVPSLLHPSNTALRLPSQPLCGGLALCGLSPQPLMRSCSKLYSSGPRGLGAAPSLTTTWHFPHSQCTLACVYAHRPTCTCTGVCTHASDAHWCAHTCRIQGVTRSRHLPARCTPAVNQCLGGAAGATTPRERRAAKGHPGFPQPLMVAAWKESGACQPVSCPLPFPDEEMGLREEQDLVGATYQWQVGLELLSSPRGLSWSSVFPTQPQMSAPHPSLSCAPGLEGRGPRGPCPLFPDCNGQQGGVGYSTL